MHGIVDSPISHENNRTPPAACEQVASDLGLGGGFRRVLRFPPQLHLASHVTKNEIPNPGIKLSSIFPCMRFHILIKHFSSHIFVHILVLSGDFLRMTSHHQSGSIGCCRDKSCNWHKCAEKLYSKFPMRDKWVEMRHETAQEENIEFYQL